MSKVLRIIGIAWAAPVTVFGLLYVLLFSLFGWYKFLGSRGDALVWTIDKPPSFLDKMWTRWAGQTIGNVIVMKADVETDKGKIVLRHEQEHVHQCMVLGVFQPIIYGIAYLGLCCCRSAHPYYDNPFEVDARRAAGQIVDVIGVLRRAVAEGKIKVLPKQP